MRAVILSVVVLSLATMGRCDHLEVTQRIKQDGVLNLATLGSVVYGTMGRRGMVALNVSKGSMVATAQPESGHAMRLHVIGDFGYLADGIGGMAIYDFMDPSVPVRIGSIVLGSKKVAEDIVGNAKLAFVYCLSPDSKTASIFLVDVTNPEDPLKVDKVTVPKLQSMQILDEFLYILSASGTLYTYKINSNNAIRLIGETQYGLPSCCITASSTHVFIAAGDEIHILNQKNIEVSTVYVTFKVLSMVATNGYLYLGTGTGLAIVDVANERAAFLLVTKQGLGSLGSMVVHNNVIYAVSSGKEIVSIEGLPLRTLSRRPMDTDEPTPVSAPVTPVPPVVIEVPPPETPSPPIGEYPSSVIKSVMKFQAPPKSLFGSRGFLYLSLDGKGTAMLETSTLSRPTVIGSASVTSPVNAVAQHEGLFVVADHDGFKIHSADSTFSMRGLFSIPSYEGVIKEIDVYLQVAYVFLTSTYNSYLYIIDISSAEEPFGVGKMDTEGEVTLTVRRGTRLYAVTTERYIMVWDNTSPKVFNLKAKYRMDKIITALDVTGDTMFVGQEQHIYIMHAEGSELRFLSKVNVVTSINSLVWFEGYVFVAGDYGAGIVDVRDARIARMVGMTETSAKALFIEVIDWTAYVALQDCLLVIDARPNEVKHGVSNKAVFTEEIDFGSRGDEEFTKVPATVKHSKKHNTGIVRHVELLITPNVKVDVRKGAPNMAAWSNYGESKLSVVPKFFNDVRMYFPKEDLASGSEVEVVCLFDSCTVYVMFESCYPCSMNYDGGLPMLLIQEGWIRIPCSPKFFVSVYGKPHDMVVFSKKLYHKDVELLPKMVRPMKYLALAIVSDTECARHTTVTSCRQKFNSAGCVWDQMQGRCTSSPPVCQAEAPSPPSAKCMCASEDLGS
eukprot:TRINITY_DN161_c1_g1_i1.p1 TRINITY_DN161_c1_g1~~TRINITY_DN161_c1_g1_i1.p1  ORF type:complete len:906 (+),score=132.47 TRINITY_DN161_c1_g1_i1:28-2718(+)